MKTNTKTNTAPLSKDQALKKYDKATRLRWRSPISEWRAAFPTVESLAEFRRDVGDLSWPGSYGQSPWDDAFSLAYNLGAGISESSQRYMLDNADCDWGRQMLAVYAEYGIKVEPSPAPVAAPVAESSPLVPLSAPVGVSGVTLPDSTAKDTPEGVFDPISHGNPECRRCGQSIHKHLDENGDLFCPASPVDSVGVPAYPTCLLIHGKRNDVDVSPETGIAVEYSDHSIQIRATVGELCERWHSHAANLAKIKALEVALRDLLESVECALGISDYDCKDSLRDAEKAGELQAARKALALPSA